MKETGCKNLNRIVRLTPHIMQIDITMRRSYSTAFEWVHVTHWINEWLLYTVVPAFYNTFDESKNLNENSLCILLVGRK